MSQTKEKFPPQIRYIVGNEACERFSFYGMRSILVVFMTSHLLMRREDAMGVYHYFVAAVYLLPLLGGWLSDRFLGKYKTIFWLSIVYCLGHLTLALFESEKGLYWGLGLIALGSGGIKPCVSAFVGDQFTAKNQNLLERVFDIFYFSINFGATFSSLLIPVLLIQFGPSVAFGIPGVLMALALVIFVAGRKQYVEIPPTAKADKQPGFLSVVWNALLNLGGRKKGESFFSAARSKLGTEAVDGAEAVWGIIKVFATVSVFWALFDQNGSSWVLQGQKMEQNFFGLHIDPSQMQAANPIMVMLLIPFFSYVIYPFLEKRGVKVTPLRKMGAGMLLSGTSFIAIGFLETLLGSGAKLNIMWQVIPYLLLTCSEVMVSITGLEFAYTQAPRSAKSTIMSFWLLTVFFGNLLTGYIAKINVFKQEDMFFYFFGVLALAVSVIFIFNATRYKMRNYMGGAKPAEG